MEEDLAHEEDYFDPHHSYLLELADNSMLRSSEVKKYIPEIYTPDDYYLAQAQDFLLCMDET